MSVFVSPDLVEKQQARQRQRMEAAVGAHVVFGITAAIWQTSIRQVYEVNSPRSGKHEGIHSKILDKCLTAESTLLQL